ncbi:hypothetical protein MKW94_008500 [Papaver nudicaule]|uniref:FLZ-type domain-containing protein n=1 Tax=Papaver nudicaule TaxID=74823 RepID=A0AA41V048_PAPNU|nr:hypothetical protein [Papaver nudicaule]
MENSSYVCTVRRPAACFIEQDNGLASIADSSAKVGFSGNPISPPKTNPFLRKRASFRSLSSFNSTSARYYEVTSPRSEEPHFLESCFLYKKHIGNNRDIFMYNLPRFPPSSGREEREGSIGDGNLSLSSQTLIHSEQPNVC